MIFSDRAACEFINIENEHFTFEYDDWGNLELIPENPENDSFVEELNILADKIELFESHDMENVLKYSIKNNEYPKRKRLLVLESSKQLATY